MARVELSGLGIEYDLIGDAGAPAVAITPGGRFSKDAPGVPEMGRALADKGLRVLLWDRPNCGASDISFDGDSESMIQARALIELVRHLDLGPTTIAGGSAGARVSIFAALHDPDAVSKLTLWWISGGIVSLTILASAYCAELAISASMGGMEAVAAMPAWAEQIQRNPRNREILLRQDPKQFIATMERWAAGFIPWTPAPAPGLTKENCSRLKMPVMIFKGSPTDLFHPASVCEEVHALIPHSTLVDSPWPDDTFAKRMLAGEGHFLDWPLLAPAIADFAKS